MLLRALKLLLIAVAVMLIMALCAILFVAATQVPQMAMLAVVLVCAAFLWVVTMLSSMALARRRRAGAVLSYVEQAVRHNLPLPRVIRAIGEVESGRRANSRFARDMIAAEQALQEGAPLAVVLSAVPQIPSRVIGLLSAAERVGRLPQVMARVMDERRDAFGPGRHPGLVPFYRTYSLLLGLALVFVTSMLAVFVAPKFEQIFKAFRIPLPWITQLTFQTARQIGPWLAVLIAGGLIALMIAAAASRWRGGAMGWVEGPFDWIANRLPWLGRVRLNRALGDALEFTADAIQSGRPIDTSLREAAQISPNSRLRGTFDRWHAELTRGGSIAEAARKAGVPVMACSMLSTAVQTPELAEVLRFLGRYYSSKFSRAVALAEASLVPLIALVMGGLVAWLALSVFMPMVRLLDRLGPYSKGFNG